VGSEQAQQYLGLVVDGALAESAGIVCSRNRSPSLLDSCKQHNMAVLVLALASQGLNGDILQLEQSNTNRCIASTPHIAD
jgi:hypothetical protein